MLVSDMRRGRTLDDGTEAADMEEGPPRRPWALIAASLILVVLVAVLWVKWSGSRRDVARLGKELTRVYKEAEDLRLQAALAHERISKLEREVRALHAERERLSKPPAPEEKPKTAKPPVRR
jgi:septal ring factor EnvC (AmiA/AmiB activator)